MVSGKGILITLEGNEGSGKSTQIRLLADDLRSRGIRVLVTREPGGTKVGNRIRKILLDRGHGKMSPECETLLYMASRAELVYEIVAPALRAGKVVLCDRWLDATIAYQGYGGGVDVEWIRSLGEKATRGLRPRLTLFLDLAVAAGLRRARSRKTADRIEKKTLAFHQRVRRGYLCLMRLEPRRIRRVRVRESDSVRSVHEKIKKAVAHVLRQY